MPTYLDFIEKQESVLFVTHSKRGMAYYRDPSARYRCLFPAEHLRNEGVTADVVHISMLDKALAQQYQHVIFHRPQYSMRLERIIRHLKKSEVQIYVDFDDLLFNTSLADQSPAVLSGAMLKRTAIQEAQKYFKAITQFTSVIVSTDQLKKELLSILPNQAITVVYNKTLSSWVDLTPTVAPELRVKNKLIRYFPGTSHHKNNLASITKALAEIPKNIPDAQIEIVGDIELPQEAQGYINTTPYVSYEDLPALISECWVTIAPLTNNRFNQCKSALKFWESAAFGVPLIASESGDLKRVSSNNILLSDDPNCWVEFLNKISKVDYYHKISVDLKNQAASSTYLINSDVSYNELSHAYKLVPEFLKHTDKIKKSDLKTKKTRKTIRKIKKLIKTPELFFTDMIKKL